MTISVTDVDTPVGPLRIAVRGPAVVACAFADHWDRVVAPVRRRFDDDWIDEASAAAGCLASYVAGDLGALAGLAVDVEGTGFQQRVWSQLRAIPVGETRSYADVAGAVGQPTATRAVGTANGRNPVWVVVPCHRVVRAGGAVGGYGGGVERKRWLLAHERAVASVPNVPRDLRTHVHMVRPGP